MPVVSIAGLNKTDLVVALFDNVNEKSQASKDLSKNLKRMAVEDRPGLWGPLKYWHVDDALKKTRGYIRQIGPVDFCMDFSGISIDTDRYNEIHAAGTNGIKPAELVIEEFKIQQEQERAKRESQREEKRDQPRLFQEEQEAAERRVRIENMMRDFRIQNDQNKAKAEPKPVVTIEQINAEFNRLLGYECTVKKYNVYQYAVEFNPPKTQEELKEYATQLNKAGIESEATKRIPFVRDSFIEPTIRFSGPLEKVLPKLQGLKELTTSGAAVARARPQKSAAAEQYIPGPSLFSGLQRPSAGAGDIINEENKQKFFRHVARGEQDEAQAMLKRMPELVFVKGRFDDISDKRCLANGDKFERVFQNISAWQYAIWAGDIHMCRMMKNCFTTAPQPQMMAERAKIQWTEVQEGLGDFAADRHGRQFDLTPLINALNTHVEQYAGWNAAQRKEHSCQVIGGFERMLPTHIINESFREDRSFVVNGSPPDFLDETLPRKAVLNDGPDFYLTGLYCSSTIGVDGVCYVGNYGLAKDDCIPRHQAKFDAAAFSALQSRRAQQVSDLPNELEPTLKQSVGLART